MGSFLNVVVYRIPAGLSIWTPRWSFCPACEAPIPWYDNLPLISYLRLGGRARCCGTPISLRYPVIEVATAVIVLLLLDAFFVDRVRTGLCETAIGLSWRLAEDWPVFLAHVVLFACLLAMSAIDIEHYWIDTVFASVAVVAGCVLHMLWTPSHSLAGATPSGGWIRPFDVTAVTCLAASAGLLAAAGVRWRLDRRLGERDDEQVPQALPGGATGDDPGGVTDDPASDAASALTGETGSAPPPSAEPEDSDEAETSPDAVARPTARRAIGAWCLTLMLAGMIVAIARAAMSDAGGSPHTLRLTLPLAGLFGLIVIAGMVERPSDRAIVEAIESERVQARVTALRELGWLMPAILLAGAALSACEWSPAVQRWTSDLLHWRPAASWNWQPVFGLATAATGFAVAAGIGWAIRIGATLIYGKEAFGDGDIHVMAAAGCVAGWPVVLLGFILTCVIALAGWVISLPFKRTRAIPLVPWLSLSFLVVAVFYESATQMAPVQNVIEMVRLFGFPGIS